MPEKRIKGVVRSLNAGIEEKDIEKMLLLYAEDATLVTPEGTFTGREEIKRYWSWQVQQASKVTSTETEMIVEEDKLAAEHIIEVEMIDGGKWRVPIACIYHFTDGKIQNHKMSYDRLSVAKQAAQGWFATKLVGSIVGRMEKGLR